ncbi:hypothetical protein [Microbulbifer agarilyticus]
MTKNLFTLIAFLTLPTLAIAATTLPPEDVDLLYVRGSDGLFGVYAKDRIWDNNEGCEDDTRVVIDPSLSEKIRAEFVSIIIAQKIASKPMSFYVNGCVTWNGVSHPKIIGIYVH